jgi:phage portal protein BeeE
MAPASIATMRGVLKHPGRLSPEAGKRLKESWNSQYAGTENAHKTAVLEEGMDLISVGTRGGDAVGRRGE